VTSPFQFVKQAVANLRARIAKHYVTKQIIATLRLAHADELAHTPGEMWGQIQAKHVAQIQAVRDGKIDIVDRRSWAFPYLPSTLTRLQQPIIKMLPYNLRRFARTPVPRRAINLIKNAVTSLDWNIVPIKNASLTSDEDQATRIDTVKKCFQHPNNDQSFQELLETGIDDFCVMGAMVVEPQITPDPERPIKMWNVDCSTIRFFPNWRESAPDDPKYAQMTGLKGERGIIVFYADELMYIKDNPSVETPFGTSKMEIGFMSITHFLGVQEMSGKAGADQVHKTWMWWETSVAQNNLDIVRRHITNDLEGQAKVSLMAGIKAPEVIDITTVTGDDILLPWQEMLIRMIAAAFDMSAQAFLERDINRSTGEVLQDMDFRSAVVPTAVRIAEHFTRFILHKKLGWTDLEFQFLNLDDPDLQTKIDMMSKIYSMNAYTPNEIRAELGKPPLPTPYANLTQFEAILVNTQAAAAVADATAAKASDRTAQQQQQQMEQYQQMQQQPPQEEDDEPQPTPGKKKPADKQQAAAGVEAPVGPKPLQGPKPLKLTPPKAPTLAKMPMAGSRYNCYQIAAMSVSELKSAIAKGDVPSDPSTLQQNMKNQDPSILQQMEPAVVQYLDMLKKQQDAEDNKSKPKITPQAIKDQRKKFNKEQHIPADIERNLFPNNIRPGDITPSYSSIKPTFADKRSHVKTTNGIVVKRNRKPKTSDQIQRDTAGTGRGKEISITDSSKHYKKVR
jgi:hypothetical protein